MLLVVSQIGGLLFSVSLCWVVFGCLLVYLII